MMILMNYVKRSEEQVPSTRKIIPSSTIDDRYIYPMKSMHHHRHRYPNHQDDAVVQVHTSTSTTVTSNITSSMKSIL